MKKEVFDKEEVYRSIYQIVRKIPKGRVTTYGAISKALLLSTPRIVGRAMGIMHNVKPPMPFQRVVSSQGLLSGDNTGVRQEKLEAEGIIIENKRVKNFKQLFWDPTIELGV